MGVSPDFDRLEKGLIIVPLTTIISVIFGSKYLDKLRDILQYYVYFVNQLINTYNSRLMYKSWW